MITNITKKNNVNRPNCNEEDVILCGIAIHYGVVGNMQASHVCAPGSIPGDGTFYMRKKRTTTRKRRREEGRSGVDKIQ